MVQNYNWISWMVAVDICGFVLKYQDLNLTQNWQNATPKPVSGFFLEQFHKNGSISGKIFAQKQFELYAPCVSLVDNSFNQL